MFGDGWFLTASPDLVVRPRIRFVWFCSFFLFQLESDAWVARRQALPFLCSVPPAFSQFDEARRLWPFSMSLSPASLPVTPSPTL